MPAAPHWILLSRQRRFYAGTRNHRACARRRARRQVAQHSSGEFVREEMHHIREGKHGAASTKQAIAIGLSKARRSGVKLSPPRAGKTSASTRQKAQNDYREGQSQSHRRPSARRSKATSNALKKKGHSAASHASLSKQARTAARNRGSSSRRNAARKASRTRKHVRA